MARPFRKGHAGKGLPPGTLVSRTRPGALKAMIKLYSYNSDRCDEILDVPVGRLKNLVGDSSAVHWVIVNAVHDAAIVQAIGECFGLQPLIMEDILNPDHPVKMEDWDDYSYFVLKNVSAKNAILEVTISQVSMIVFKKIVITFCEVEEDFLKPVIARLVGGKGKMRRSGTEYLAYAVIDSIVDHYYTVVEMFSDQIDELEPMIFDNPSGDLINRIFRLKRETLMIRNAIRPLESILDGIIHPDSELFPEQMNQYFRDVSDHVTHVVETLEIFREILSQMVENAMTSLSNRMTEAMKTLTIIATIFIPLTFIAGIYGMNFDWMPELRMKWGYPAVLMVMVTAAIGMIRWFRRRKWF